MFNIDKTSFSIKRKTLASSYSSVQAIKNRFSSGRGTSASLLDINSFLEGSQLDKYFRAPGSNSLECTKLSTTLYDTNRIYSQLLNYLSNMFYWRYTVVPRKIKTSSTSKIGKEEYKKMYSEMLEYADGISIETVFPTLLLYIFKNGKVNFSINADTKSKTISTIILPDEYCKSTFLTQYGTQEVMFDFSFFDSLGLKKEQLVELLNSFPQEFTELYNEYLENKSNRWKTLNAKYSTCISMNEEGFPTFLSVFYDIIDYKTYKLNELDRNTNQLERIITHEVDMEKTGMDMKEIEELHDSLADVVCENKGATLITSPGRLGVQQLQEDVGQENKTLSNAYKTIYDNAGFNNELFSGDSDYSLSVSLKRDEVYVWNFVQKIESFYNLAINNCKHFHKNYQLSLKMLPISFYNEGEKLEIYHQAATLGVGVIDYIVATGTKQVDLESTLELEESLDLMNRLVPLQSSHTQSATSTEGGNNGMEDAPKEGEDDTSKEDANDEVNTKDSKENEEKE